MFCCLNSKIGLPDLSSDCLTIDKFFPIRIDRTVWALCNNHATPLKFVHGTVI